MYARIARLQASPAHLEEVGRFERESVRRLCEDIGYRGFMLLTQPGAGTCVTITYWESEAAMQACDRLAATPEHPRWPAVRARSVERLRLVSEG